MHTDTDGDTYPSPHWCSIGQACRWIAAKEIPYQRDIEKRVERHTPPIDDTTYRNALKDIRRLAYKGKITLQGCSLPNISYRDVKFYYPLGVGAGVSIIDQYGVRDIVTKIEHITADRFERVSITDCFTLIFPCVEVPGEYCAYTNVIIDFRQLLDFRPAPEGITIYFDDALLNPTSTTVKIPCVDSKVITRAKLIEKKSLKARRILHRIKEIDCLY